ncbi:Lrp/AsnC family transcriptional regulator [Candidatus Woesearchaeota archaeon]|nr:Lrp/AsnC family transcriptional regulator [Candidatus Woesearchaeota archaeon]
MANIKLDVKDRRILDVLDKNPNLALSQIAKKVGVSTQVAEYRIKRLLSQKTIYAFYALIDPGRLGYTLFRVHIKLKNVTEEAYTKFAKDLFEKYPTFWVAFVSGPFDIITDIWAKNSNAFEELSREILEKNLEIIESYEINPILELDLYEYGYFLEEKKERSKTILFKIFSETKLDESDKRILSQIKANSRLPYETIGRKVRLSRNAVKYRIKNLEKSGVIAGYKTMIDFKHFDRLTYKIFIKYDNSKISQEKQLLLYLKNVPAILATTKLLGKWNLDIEIEPKNAKELQRFMIDLRNKFNIIEDYEFIQIIEDYGIDFYPNKLM